jgi:hypothetical protein
MEPEDHKEATRQVQAQVDEILRHFNRVLADTYTFNGEKYAVVSFKIAPIRDLKDHLRLAAAPCPTKCVLLPNGAIECRPDCS